MWNLLVNDCRRRQKCDTTSQANLRSISHLTSIPLPHLPHSFHLDQPARV